MTTGVRRFLDKVFTATALLSVLVIVLSLLVVLAPMLVKGSGAVVFRGTSEFRRMQLAEFGHGDEQTVRAQWARVQQARRPIAGMVAQFKAQMATQFKAADDASQEEKLSSLYREFKKQLKESGAGSDQRLELQELASSLRRDLQDAFKASDPKEAIEKLDGILRHRQDVGLAGTAMDGLFLAAAQYRQTVAAVDFAKRDSLRESLAEVERILTELLGPRWDQEVDFKELQAQQAHMPPENRYGATRLDLAQKLLSQLMLEEQWVAQGQGQSLRKEMVPRQKQFEGTALAGLFPYVQSHLDDLLCPRLTFYWRFFTDDSTAGHYFGGVLPEILGTLALTVLAIAVAMPIGVISAGYLIEVAGDNLPVRIIRTCINTLAGVPSIVFGLFGLGFFVVFLLPRLGGTAWAGRSILAGSLTLAVLILPIIIRASEEAIRSVPQSFKEAALGLGASRFRCFVTVTLPAAMPGILTGLILGMSRAAGETAPILFTAGVAMGPIPDSIAQETRTLSYSSWYMAVSDKTAAMAPHQQYGMVMTLVALVLILNIAAIILRSRVSKKLRGQ